jgi:hypothetical protein
MTAHPVLRSDPHKLGFPLPPRALARGGEGSGVGGKQQRRIFPPPRFAIARDCEPTLPAASRGEGKEGA